MVGILGRIWEFSEPLTTISWNAPRPMAEDKIADIKAALENDIANESNPPDDPYFGGKKMALFARLSLIADEIGETELAQQVLDSSIKCSSRLQTSFDISFRQEIGQRNILRVG